MMRRCPTGDNPDTGETDETDCELVVAEGGFGTGATHNKCHVDCSGRGVCDYDTGLCDCFRGFWGEACNKRDALAAGTASGGGAPA
jgi:hypothetical protein